MASLGNIAENPHIGIIFLDLYQSTVGLHVNGTARILSPEDVQTHPHVPADIMPVVESTGGHHPECWVLVEVQEAYIHCSKHIPLVHKLDKDIQWGTDDDMLKGGDFFRAKSSPRTLPEPAERSPEKT